MTLSIGETSRLHIGSRVMCDVIVKRVLDMIRNGWVAQWKRVRLTWRAVLLVQFMVESIQLRLLTVGGKPNKRKATTSAARPG